MGELAKVEEMVMWDGSRDGECGGEGGEDVWRDKGKGIEVGESGRRWVK